MDINCIPLLRHLQPLTVTLGKISWLLPELFSQGNDLERNKKQENTVLREWEVESSHDYENNTNLTKVNL